MEENSTTTQTRLHAIVHGRVQGVNFRYYTRLTAERLGVTGWVANRWDGTVEVVAEGARDNLGQMLTFLHRGSPSASVQRVDVDWQTPTGEFEDFKVRFI
jgi:acylphosphatase